MIEDPFNALCAHDDVTITGASEGPLAGMTFVAKDLFDIEGHITGAGNPDWLRTHEPAARTAPAVTALTDAGATLVAKSITDELAYSLLGVNAHYGTPVNPASPDAIPGGSSSGSAVAVAGGLVDFALGTDTAGSVRVPAALCGIYGFRPTHDAVSLEATFPLAPSFDTVGWFGREALVLWQVADVLLPATEPERPSLRRLVVADDLFDATDEPLVDALIPQLERLAVRFETQHVPALAADGLTHWAETLRVLQGAEIWARHGPWLETENPTLALDVRDRIDALRAISDDDVTRARAARDQISSHLHELLAHDGMLLTPTVPELAPLLTGEQDDFNEFRRRTLQLTCTATLAGLPQVTIPVTNLADYPVGLSLIGPAGSDRQLIALAGSIAPTA